MTIASDSLLACAEEKAELATKIVAAELQTEQFKKQLAEAEGLLFSCFSSRCLAPLLMILLSQLLGLLHKRLTPKRMSLTSNASKA